MFSLLIVLIIIAVIVLTSSNKRQKRQFEHERSMMKEREALYSVTPDRLEKLREEVELLTKLNGEEK